MNLDSNGSRPEWVPDLKTHIEEQFSQAIGLISGFSQRLMRQEQEASPQRIHRFENIGGHWRRLCFAGERIRGSTGRSSSLRKTVLASIAPLNPQDLLLTLLNDKRGLAREHSVGSRL